MGLIDKATPPLPLPRPDAALCAINQTGPADLLSTDHRARAPIPALARTASTIRIP
jgi:hypothetical protein